VAALNGVAALFASTDTNDFLDGGDEYLAVADPAGMGRLLDRFDSALDQTVVQNHLDLHLGQEVHDIFSTTVQFRVAFLSPETFGFGDGNPLDPDFVKGFLHLVEFEGLNNGFYFLHGRGQ
jgi:hypothetical protein